MILFTLCFTCQIDILSTLFEIFFLKTFKLFSNFLKASNIDTSSIDTNVTLKRFLWYWHRPFNPFLGIVSWKPLRYLPGIRRSSIRKTTNPLYKFWFSGYCHRFRTTSEYMTTSLKSRKQEAIWTLWQKSYYYILLSILLSTTLNFLPSSVDFLPKVQICKKFFQKDR